MQSRFRTGSHSPTTWPIRFIGIAGGASFIAFWLLAERSRLGGPSDVVHCLVFGGLIVLSAFRAQVALLLAGLFVALQLVGLAPGPTATTWPAYGAVAVLAFFAGAYEIGLGRLVSLGLGLLLSVLIGARMTFESSRGGSWGNWVGHVDQLHPVRADLAVLSSAAFGLFAAAWVAGFAMRSVAEKRQLSERLTVTQGTAGQLDLELRLTQEREQIARDVHDSMAHALAVISAQATGGSAQAATRPDTAVAVLDQVALLAQSALRDLQAVLAGPGSLADRGERQGFKGLPALFESSRQGGLTITEVTEGTPATQPTDAGRVAYRVVQEALTNVIKHGDVSRPVRVRTSWSATEVEVSVSSSLADGPRRTTSSGHGLRGMGGRVEASGGTLTAGPAGAGTWAVVAHLPLNGREAMTDALV